MQIAPEVEAKYPKLAVFRDKFGRKENQVFWDDSLIDKLSMVAASPNILTWKFEVNEIHCNQLGNLHGGCVATLIDICSSFAIYVAEGKTWNLAGVSTDLSVSYLRGVPEGETITLVCEVGRVGKALANLHTKVYDKDNRLCYAGTHTKFNIDSPFSFDQFNTPLTIAMASFYDEIEIEDMDFNEEDQLYTYPCPCGDKFEIYIDDLMAGDDIARCPSCSLMIKVIYDPDDFVDEEDEATSFEVDTSIAVA